MKTKGTNIYPYWLSFPALGVYSVFYVLPLVAALALSITDWNAMRFWEPEFVGIDNFLNFFTDKNFFVALKNTFLIAGVTTIMKTLIGFLLALALIKPLKTRNLMRTVYFMPAVYSSVLIGLIFTSIFRMDGLFTDMVHLMGFNGVDVDWLGNPDYSLYVIMFTEIWQWSGYSMIIFIAGLQSIPKEYYEASEIDGASSFQQMWNITIPMLTAAFNLCITIALIGGLKIFATVFVLTNGGPGFETDVLARYTYMTFGQGLYGKASAISLAQSIIIIIFSLTLNSWMKRKEVEL